MNTKYVQRRSYLLFDSISFQIIALRERQSALQDSLHRVRDHDVASQNVDERIRLEKDLHEVKDRLSRYDHTTLCSQSQSHMSAITSAGDRTTVVKYLSFSKGNDEIWFLFRLIIEILFLLNV